ncbi:SDR family oxidoreductase [Actinomadura macrotermitis]|uniref:3-phenylpropionate-dihydrodiol/cinnamic acid-dihydrodiol dehydrogenase n=1 Tax=Actinomadura macrotermitis TaxID=2585200 RepID=A0A7K0C0H9_9ACTN|nr:SDR family oxidoreductase [Actinomadura macrotermitis]MQY06973.1 3-phenylpropionate-dihydrodiol/cinnamic acid-dihydrodiol dehydrogenase [Actinomadura macrotermitis]
MRYRPITLPGAVTVITGGAQGIGRETARAFAARGAVVCIGDLDQEKAERTAAELGDRVRAFGVDVTDRASYAAFLDAVTEQAGPVDILVNNAGVMPLGPFLEEPDAVSATTMKVNVDGLIHGMRLVLPGMVARRHGHVANVASLAGKIPIAGMAVYNASKYAAVGLTASVREEMRPHGVSVSAILPSAVRTRLTEGIRLGHGLPTVDPDRIADAVVRSCRTRRAEYAVPGWLGLAQPLLGITPEPAVQAVKRLIGGDRAYRASFGTRGEHDRHLIEQARRHA